MTPPAFHELRDFGELLRVVAASRRIDAAMVEKDYWVVYCLKAIQDLGWGIHFKGGTSLSKGYGIIQRFSEDLDLKLEPSGDWRLPAEHNWKSEGKEAIRARGSFFDRLVRELQIPGCEPAEEARDPHGQSIAVRVSYPMHAGKPPGPLRSGVLLEIGHARVAPSEVRKISSWVAEHVAAMPAGVEASIPDPVEVPCVLPAVTLLEKVDAVSRHYPGKREGAAFVRHYEDAAAIVRFLEKQGKGSLAEVKSLHEQMVAAKDIRPLDSEAGALRMGDPARNVELEEAWRAAASLHWGERLSLADCAQAVRGYLRKAEIGR